MKEEEKDCLSCDEVFTLYLGHVSKHVNQIYYKTVLKFILLYRECLNAQGWQNRRELFIKAGVKMEEDIVFRRVRSKESSMDWPEQGKLPGFKRYLRRPGDKGMKAGGNRSNTRDLIPEEDDEDLENENEK